MLLVIVLAMAVIVSAWSIWFFPRQSASAPDGASFKNFTRDILKSFSVFAPEPQKTENKVNIDDLRSRVFGDAIERAE